MPSDRTSVHTQGKTLFLHGCIWEALACSWEMVPASSGEMKGNFRTERVTQSEMRSCSWGSVGEVLTVHNQGTVPASGQLLSG